MTTKLVERIVKKFKNTDISFIVREWEFIKRNTGLIVNEPCTKSDLIAFINGVIKKQNFKITQTDVGQLELIYINKYSSSRMWNAYRSVQDNISHSSLSPTNFHEEFSDVLSSYMTCLSTSLVIANVSWMWFDISKNNRVPKIIYLVHPQGTDFLFLSGNLGSCEKFYLEAFKTVLRASSVQHLHLNGRCLQSLYDMTVKAFPPCREHSEKIADIMKPTKRKRILSVNNNEVNKNVENCGATYESVPKRVCYELDTNVEYLPVLQTVKYTMNTNFRGLMKGHRVHSELSKEKFYCSVTFNGENVIEGLKKLVNCNIASSQLNNHVTQLKASARNNFIVENA